MLRDFVRRGQSLFQLWTGLEGQALERARRQKYKDLFSTPLGQEVLADIIMSAGYLAAYSPENPHTDSFHAGRRFMVAEILKTCGIGEESAARVVLNDDLNGAFDHDGYGDE